MNQAQRVLKIIEFLAGHESEGVRNKDIAAAFDLSPATVTRDMQIMVDAGVAETVGENFRLGPTLIRVALAHRRHVDDVKKKYDSMVSRYGGE